MGIQSSSFSDSINKGAELKTQILHTVAELKSKYREYTSSDVCNRIALIYTDRLMDYSNVKLREVAYRFGMTANLPKEKAKLCQMIVKHYHDRIELLKLVESSIDDCSVRIFALTSGPACLGRPDIHDQKACQVDGGQWIKEFIPGVSEFKPQQARISPPDQNLEPNRVWYQNLNQMGQIYIRTLTQLVEILTELDDDNTIISNERLNNLRNRATTLIVEMRKGCQALYDVMRGMPTFSKAEAQAINRAKAGKASQAKLRSELGHATQ